MISTQMQFSGKCLLSRLPIIFVSALSHLSLFPAYFFVRVCPRFLPSRLISIPGQGMQTPLMIITVKLQEKSF